MTLYFFCLLSCSRRLWLVRFSRARRTITPRVSPDSSSAHVLVSPPTFHPSSLPAPSCLLALPYLLTYFSPLPVLVAGTEEISPRVLQTLGSEPIQVGTHCNSCPHSSLPRDQSSGQGSCPWNSSTLPCPSHCSVSLVCRASGKIRPQGLQTSLPTAAAHPQCCGHRGGCQSQTED